jgi:hypothetical protein
MRAEFRICSKSSCRRAWWREQNHDAAGSGGRRRPVRRRCSGPVILSRFAAVRCGAYFTLGRFRFNQSAKCETARDSLELIRKRLDELTQQARVELTGGTHSSPPVPWRSNRNARSIST